jgi:transposase InsO family protein
MDSRPLTQLTVRAVTMGIRSRRPEDGLIHHSDHGAQYTAIAFTTILEDAGLRGSMGKVGDALDNAMAESFFATLQTELLDRRSWPDRQTLKTGVFQYIETFYNSRRRHSSLGYLSPIEFERRWSTAQTPAILFPYAKP